GVRDTEQATELAAAGVESIVLGLETVRVPEVVRRVCSDLGSERVVFSLDLKDGTPWGDRTAWQRPDAGSIAGEAITAGGRGVVGLVGGAGGVGRGTRP